MSFVASSQNVRIEHGHILHAKCEDEEGNLVDSTIDLNHYIGNSDGWFVWGAKNFSHSAEAIDLRGGYHLEALLQKIDGSYRERQGINLNDRISNLNGKLTYVGN